MRLTVNNQPVEYRLDPETPLLWALRDASNLTGTKYGCGTGHCGACIVDVDGVARASCQVPIGSIEGSEVTTIEGMEGPEVAAVQAAWTAIDVPQCGWCQSGQVMSATMLLQQLPAPTDQQIDEAMAGNICRCATYHRIRAAVHEAARLLEA